MAKISSQAADESTIPDLPPRDASREDLYADWLVSILFAALGSVVLGLFLGGLFLAVGSKDAGAGREIARELAENLTRQAVPGGRAAETWIAALLIILVAASLGTPALAGDTDRLAGCIAASDQAGAVAKTSDAGASPDRTVAFTPKDQQPVKSSDEVNSAARDVYSDGQLTPDQASAKAFQNCFEAE
jgi:hypothetical protein